jgi:pyruvate-formate lyase-activating enzyme
MAAEIHNFARKLNDPRVFDVVARSVLAEPRREDAGSLAALFRSELREATGPISINLDLTVACNYRCPHCVDADILNTGYRYRFEDVRRSLVVMRMTGLRSVILIGGGEPTIHPHFVDVVRVIKALGLQCGIVSNGGNNEVLEEAAPALERGDWIRLSLDAASNDVFRAMHLPRKRTLTLEHICAGVSPIKAANPDVSIGFSFIVAGPGASVAGRPVPENIDEIASAAKLAKDSRFDYISFKPLLDRDETGAESVFGPDPAVSRDACRRIGTQLIAAQKLQGDGFKVVPSLNLTAILDEIDTSEMREQPKRCHMHLLRHIVTPVGTFGCPVYRANPRGRIGGPEAYSSVESFITTRRKSYELRDTFDAAVTCKNVTCLYNSTNRWLDSMCSTGTVPPAGPPVQDFFL